MTDHEKKIEIMRKYYKEIKTSFDFFIKGDIPIKRVDNALKKFASGMDRTTMIGFYDTTSDSIKIVQSKDAMYT